MESNRIVLFSLKPKYWELIIKEEKVWEFRRCIPQIIEENLNKNINQEVWIYSSFPQKKVVGKLLLGNIIKEPIEDLFSRLKDQRIGVNKRIFDKYFHNKKEGYALGIVSISQFPIPRDLLVSPPQNFRYITENMVSN